MIVAGRRKSITFFICLGVALIAVILLLYVGWVLLNWRTGILLFFGVLLLATIISGVVLNTIFLVREIRRNEQHNAFINAVTHELKTPVASIRLYLETLITHTIADQKRNEFYQIMLDDSERLLSTIEQVLRTGRIGASKPLLSSAPLDLAEVLKECVDRARTTYNLQAECLTYRAASPVNVRGDRDEMRAAIFNLIDNAVKYSGSDVHVTVDAAKIDGKCIAVRVKDEGIGIPKAELGRIFKRFYRIPHPTSSRQEGTGLGLYIVRSVAKRHGGRAWAESSGPGRGSTFVFQVPMWK